jgi:hypothetical protein
MFIRINGLRSTWIAAFAGMTQILDACETFTKIKALRLNLLSIFCSFSDKKL